MNDDWRLRIELEDEGHLAGLVKRLDAQELEDELSDSFGDRVILSREGRVIFAYTETRAQAEAVHDRVLALDEEHSWAARTELRHWHPIADSWEEPDVPLPESDAARAAEHAEAIAAEREHLAETGEPEYEVRIELPSHGEAGRLAERLRAEGLPVVRRWKYLVVGAADEDQARELAHQLELQAPGASRVSAEVSGQVAWAERPVSPFAIFGGLGG